MALVRASLVDPDVLVLDELGYLPFEANAAHLFFQLVSRRYERGSMMITSNRAVSEWGTVFGDSVVAKPRLDAVTTLAYLAGITTRVRLGTAVLLPALRRLAGAAEAGPATFSPNGTQLAFVSNGGLLLWSLAERFGLGHFRRIRGIDDQSHMEIPVAHVTDRGDEEGRLFHVLV